MTTMKSSAVRALAVLVGFCLGAYLAILLLPGADGSGAERQQPAHVFTPITYEVCVDWQSQVIPCP